MSDTEAQAHGARLQAAAKRALTAAREAGVAVEGGDGNPVAAEGASVTILQHAFAMAVADVIGPDPSPARLAAVVQTGAQMWMDAVLLYQRLNAQRGTLQ